ncbi:MAG: gliding motility protein GldD [Massilibacteroides sp.]|nr:gliding motility protein GldD [Massilibacteroides sp.]
MKWTIFIFSWLVMLLTSCQQAPTPKPYGFPRLAPPLSSYTLSSPTNIDCQFALSDSAQLILSSPDLQKGWFDIHYKFLKATLHCSVLTFTTKDKLLTACQESQQLAVRETLSAKDLSALNYSHPEVNVYGTLYSIEGEVASPLQLVLTDSIAHLFRGALYYDHLVQADSIKPITHYLRNDLMEMARTFIWIKDK